MKNEKVTMKEIKEKLCADSYSRKGDVITVKNGFFYTIGKSKQNLIDTVLKAFPNANIITSGERWSPFRGGDSVGQGSHWFVKFTL